MISRMIIFGATGDLAGRFLFPALAALHAADRLPADFRVFGIAAENWDDDTFTHHVANGLATHAISVDQRSRDAVTDQLRYRRVDLTSRDGLVHAVRDATDESTPVAVYLALPTSLVAGTVETLQEVDLPQGSRIVVEKPFGSDHAGACALNALLADASDDRSVYRVDHVLGMATVQNVLALRSTNRIFEALWSSVHIEQIDILWEETLALEGRAAFYDHAGALKDVVQNHMLQILALVAMEIPPTANAHDVQESKCALLRSVQPLTAESVRTQTVRARYTAGRLAHGGGADGREVPSYIDEAGVDAARTTETYAEIALQIPTTRWDGTRFVLRAGKALAERKKGVQITFRPVANPGPFGDPPSTNTMWIGLDGPENISMRVCGAGSSSTADMVPIDLTGHPPPSEMTAYGRVLFDILSGTDALSVSGPEAESAWQILMPVVDAWSANEVPMRDYAAGSTAPVDRRLTLPELETTTHVG